MWVKEIKKYNIKVYENGDLKYSGPAEDAPEEIKSRETKSMSFDKKFIVVEI